MRPESDMKLNMRFRDSYQEKIVYNLIAKPNSLLQVLWFSDNKKLWIIQAL